MKNRCKEGEGRRNQGRKIEVKTTEREEEGRKVQKKNKKEMKKRKRKKKRMEGRNGNIENKKEENIN